MTPDQKRDALAEACGKTPINVCDDYIYIDSCPICGVCASFKYITDEMACDLYAEAVKRGAIKEEQ